MCVCVVCVGVCVFGVCGVCVCVCVVCVGVCMFMWSLLRSPENL